MLTITPKQWAAFASRCPADYTAALFDNMALLEEAGILENERRWCHFAATVYHETGNFREIREDLNYKSASALRKAWPSRFKAKSDAELKPLLRNPIGLADQVYGCYSGRPKAEIGDVGPGQAFAWRGGGWFNTTFKPSVDGYCAKLGLARTPDNALDDPVLTLKMAVLEWTETDCNKWADENSLRKVAKAINTGSATNGIEPVGLDERKAAFARAWKYWGEAGTAEIPAKQMSLGQVFTKVVAPATAVAEVARQTVKANPDPTPNIEATKKALETAASVKGLAVDLGSLAAWSMANPILVGSTLAVVAGVWVGPALWRRFT